MSPELPKQIVQGLAGAIKGLRLYPGGHPAVARQLTHLSAGLQFLFRSREKIRLTLLDGTLVLDDHLFPPGSPAVQDIARLLETMELEGLEFLHGLTDKELETLVNILPQGKAKGTALARALEETGAGHIRALPAIPEEAEEESPRIIYGRALKVMDSIFRDVRLGRIPSSTEAVEVVKAMARFTLADPHALFALSMLKDYDNYTFTHSVNVSIISLAIGRACALSEEKLRALGLGGLLHDLGKLKIDLNIITKPGPLTDREFEQIKEHPGTGAQIVAEMDGVTAEVIDIVLGHHLRFDRSGYPVEVKARKLSPLTAMAAIADTYDAITTLRSYQRPMTPRLAVQKLRDLTGTVLHPEYTERFIASLGTYPVGSLVRIDSGEIGLVVRVGKQDPDAVTLKILFGEDGALLEEPVRVELAGREAKHIVAEVDPFLKGIDVGDYLDLD